MCTKCIPTSQTVSATKPERAWFEKNGHVCFSVTSNGMTGAEWIQHFYKKRVDLPPQTLEMLRSEHFKPTTNLYTEIVTLRPSFRIDYKRMRRLGEEYRLITPNIEIACLIRDKFTNKQIKEMGIYSIIVMHEPIDRRILLVEFDYILGEVLCGCHYYDSGETWHRPVGFAFVSFMGPPQK